MNFTKEIRPGRIQAAMMILFIMFFISSSYAKSSVDSDSAILEQSSKAIVNIVKQAKPAVVHIKVEKTTTKGGGSSQIPEEMFNHPFFEHFFGPLPRQMPRREYKQQGLGSGFIINENGLILTNNHVVEEADSIQVTLSDNRQFDAKVIGTDPQSDVALIKIEDPANLPVLSLGDSGALEVGEWVIAIGNPFGLTQTVTVGVVSATGRSSIGINEYENFIQTDAAINPGNSGGPLLNGKGEVVGINTALFSKTGGYMGIGFAIPINMAKAIEQQLQKNGKVTRGWLGVVIQDVNEDLAESFGLKSANGILVSEVQANSPASAAGLAQGDVILQLNEVVLEDVSDLRNRVAMLEPGSKAVLLIIRDGREKKVQVTIGEQPADFSKRGMNPMTGDSGMLEKFGLALQELTPELSEKFEYKKDSGLIISDVAEGSPAESAGLKPGYLIEEVNRVKTGNFEELRRALKGAGDMQKILLRVRSGSYSTYIVLSAE